MLHVEFLYNGHRFSCDNQIVLFPENILPRGISPTVLSSLILGKTFSPEVSGENVSALKDIYNFVRKQNYICSLSKNCDFTSEDISVNSVDAALSGKIKILSSLEVAMVFAKCARNAGFFPVIIMSKNQANVKIYIGADTGENFSFPVCESSDNVADLISEKKLQVFSCDSLFTAQNIDFEDACKSAEYELIKEKSKILFALDLCYYDKKSHGTPFSCEIDSYNTKSFCFGKRPSIPVNFPSGFLSEKSGAAKDLLIESYSEKYDLRQISHNCKNFCSIAVKSDDSEITLSQSQDIKNIKTSLENHLKSLIENDSVGTYFTESDIYDTAKILHEENRKCISVFSDSFLYLAHGFISIKKKDEVINVPVLLYPVKIIFKKGRIYLRILDYVPHFNSAGFEYLRNSFFMQTFFKQYAFPKNSYPEIRTYCKRFADAFNAGNAGSADFLEESFISLFSVPVDMADSFFSEKKGKYPLPQKTDNYRQEHYKPYKDNLFDVSETALGAISASGYKDVYIKAGKDCETEKTAAEAALFNMKNNLPTVIVSGDKNSSENIRSVFDSEDLSGLVLSIDAECCIADTLRASLAKLGQIKKTDGSDFCSDILREKGERLNRYHLSKTKKYDFEFSFYDALCAFESAGIPLSKEKKDTIISVENIYFPELSAKSVRKIFMLVNDLIASAKKLGTKEPLKNYPLYGIRCTDSEKTDIPDELFANLQSRLCDFSAAVSEIMPRLYIENSDIKNASSLFAFINILNLCSEYAFKSFPKNLFSEDIYKLSKIIENAKSVSLKILSLKESFYEFDQEIFDLPAKELLEKYDGNEFSFAISKEHGRNEIIKKLNFFNSFNAINKKNAREYLSALCKIAEFKEEFEKNSDILSFCLSDMFYSYNTDWDIIAKLILFAKNTDSYLKRIFKSETEKRTAVYSRLSDFIDFIKSGKGCELTVKINASKADIFGSEGLASVICDRLSADIYSLDYEDGFLSENGFQNTIFKWKSNIGEIYDYCAYNSVRSGCLNEGLSKFCLFLDENGVNDDTDKIFVRSLLFAICSQIKDSDKLFSDYKEYKSDILQFGSAYTKNKENIRNEIIDLYYKNYNYFLDSEAEKVKSFAAALENVSMSGQEILHRYGSVISHIFPVIITTCKFLQSFTSIKNVIVMNSQEINYKIIKDTLTCFERKMIFSEYDGNFGSLSYACENSGIEKFCDSHSSYIFDGRILKYLGKGQYTVEHACDFSPSLILSDSLSFDKNKVLNVPQIKYVLSAITEIAEQRKNVKIGITAFSENQINLIRTELLKTCDKSPVIREQLEKGNLVCFSPLENCNAKFDICLISAVFGNGASSPFSYNILDNSSEMINGISFSIHNILSSTLKEIYIISSEFPENIPILSSPKNGAKQLKNLLYFAKYSSVPIKIGPENSFVPNVANPILVSLCRDLIESGLSADILCGNMGIRIERDGKKYAVVFEDMYQNTVFGREMFGKTSLEKAGFEVIFNDSADLLFDRKNLTCRIVSAVLKNNVI